MTQDDRMETNPTRANGGPVRGDAPLVSGECPYPAVMATRYPDRAIGTVAGVTIIESHDPQASTYAEHMETITDPAEIRATSDERGCCDCRTFDQHERECILPDERTTPAPVGAAVALDLDADSPPPDEDHTHAEYVAWSAGHWRRRARAAEAEVVTLRAQVNGLHEELLRDDPDVVTLRAKVAAVQALAEKRDVLYPPKWAFGAEENYCNGYRQARADFIAAMATGEGK